MNNINSFIKEALKIGASSKVKNLDNKLFSYKEFKKEIRGLYGLSEDDWDSLYINLGFSKIELQKYNFELLEYSRKNDIIFKWCEKMVEHPLKYKELSQDIEKVYSNVNKDLYIYISIDYALDDGDDEYFIIIVDSRNKKFKLYQMINK